MMGDCDDRSFDVLRKTFAVSIPIGASPKSKLLIIWPFMTVWYRVSFGEVGAEYTCTPCTYSTTTLKLFSFSVMRNHFSDSSNFYNTLSIESW
jgi:hypothetical protein